MGRIIQLVIEANLEHRGAAFAQVLEADRTLLARHHHFESVKAAVRHGVDSVPT